MVAGARGLGSALLVDYGWLVADSDNSQDLVVAGWWKSWSGWSQRINESDWLILFIMLGFAAILVTVFGWKHWLLALAFLVMGSVKLVPRWLYWTLGAIVVIIGLVVLF